MQPGMSAQDSLIALMERETQQRTQLMASSYIQSHLRGFGGLDTILADVHATPEAKGLCVEYMEAAVVHIISTPYDKDPKNPRPAIGDLGEKIVRDHGSEATGAKVFNPNKDLRRMAEAQGMSEAEQGQKWLHLWTDVMKRVKQTNGICFVIARETRPGEYVLEGGAQHGEVNIAQLAGVRIEYVGYTGIETGGATGAEEGVPPDSRLETLWWAGARMKRLRTAGNSGVDTIHIISTPYRIPEARRTAEDQQTLLQGRPGHLCFNPVSSGELCIASPWCSHISCPLCHRRTRILTQWQLCKACPRRSKIENGWDSGRTLPN